MHLSPQKVEVLSWCCGIHKTKVDIIAVHGIFFTVSHLKGQRQAVSQSAQKALKRPAAVTEMSKILCYTCNELLCDWAEVLQILGFGAVNFSFAFAHCDIV